MAQKLTGKLLRLQGIARRLRGASTDSRSGRIQQLLREITQGPEAAAPSLAHQGIADRLFDVIKHDPEAAERIFDDRIRAYHSLTEMRRLVRHTGVNYCIDVGAHSGQFAGTLYGYCDFKGTCISFEPVQEFFDAMGKHIDYWPGWRSVRAGVGEKAGTGQIRLGGNHGGTSSFLEQTDAFRRIAPDVVLTERVETTPVIRLDEYLADDLRNPDHRILLKVDAQGSESAVLTSMGTSFDRVKLVLLECSSIEFYAGQALMEDLIREMRTRGFVAVHAANNFCVGPLCYDYDIAFAPEKDVAGGS